LSWYDAGANAWHTMSRRHPQPRLRPARYYRCSCQTTARLHGQPFRDYIHFLPMGLDPWSGGCQGSVARAIYSYPLGPGMLRIRVIESICQSQLGMPSAEPLQTDVRKPEAVIVGKPIERWSRADMIDPFLSTRTHLGTL
jgi:hypothetical protein